MRDLLLIGGVTVCSLLGIRNPVFGMLAFTGLGFLNPQTLTWSIGRNFPFAMVTAVGTFLGYLFWREPKRFPIRRESLLLMGLWAMFLYSTLNAFYPDEAFPRLVNISKILFMIFLAMSILNTEKRLDTLVRVIAFSIGFYALKGGVFSIVTGGRYMIHGPEDSFIGANNAIALAIAMNIPLLHYIMRTDTRSWLRNIMFIMVLFSFPAVIFTYSRGAWLGLGAGTAYLILKSRYRFRYAIAVAIMSVMLLPVLLQFLPQRLTNRYEDLVNYQTEASARSRFYNWEFATRVALARPFTGGGFNYYSEENYARFFPEFLEQWPGKVWSSHSVWFAILGEHGFPGLFLFMALIIASFLSIRKIRRHGMTPGGGAGGIDRQSYVYFADMLQGSLLVYIVVGTFYDAAYFDFFYYLIAIITVLRDRISCTEKQALMGARIPDATGKIAGEAPSAV